MPDTLVTVLGHPYANIGRGYDARLTFKAIKKAGIKTGLYDIYKYLQPNEEHKRDLVKFITNKLDTPIQVFTLNGDEVKPCFDFLGNALSKDSYKIVYPQWELEKYPKEWAESLELFDEIWAPSKFVQQSIQKSVSKEVYYIPLTIGEKLLPYAYGRRFFGLPESDFLFLLAFDFTSYLTRKNPWDVIDAFKRFIKGKEFSNAKLVLKFNNSKAKPELVQKLNEEIEPIKDYIIIVDKIMSDIETKSLIRNCDCYLSLHRSEGWGRSQAEAMVMKIPVIATDYSGNTEFMTADNSFPVKYELIPVNEGEYPFAEGQVWAQPDVDHAVTQMENVYFERYDPKLLDNAFKTIIEMYSIREVGFRFLDRILNIKEKLKYKKTTS
jgi:glycosyltransferase involved in cell wall biosynthesis